MPRSNRSAPKPTAATAARADPLGVRAYLARDWAANRDAKRHYWQARLRDRGLAEALQVTEQLRVWTAHNNPSWPTQRQRDEDFETHRRVAQALRATAPEPQRSPAARARARRVR